MTYDPVMADLNRYLNKLDREYARDDAIDEIVDEWMNDRSKVEEALEGLELFRELRKEVTKAIVSGKYDHLAGWLEDYVRQTLEERAAKELDRLIEQSLDDEAETEALWKEAFDG